MTRLFSLRRVLIVADESAEWRIAGLRQLDRILLGLNEYAARQGNPIEVFIESTGDSVPNYQPLPDGRPLAGLKMLRHAQGESFGQPNLVLTTHAIVYRAQFGDTTFPVVPEEEDRVRDRADCGRVERRLLRRSGKSQDGIVARNFDRRISRSVTRLLLKFPITPTAWTLAILPLAIFALGAFVHGGRAGILLGIILVEIHSILDGCDGEIARVKYLESQRGQRLDTICDVTTEIAMILGLAAGLSRQAMTGEATALFALEGLIAGALIVLREWLLAKSTAGAMDEPGSSVYARHVQLVNHSSLSGFKERFADFIIQLTKRDVAISFFLFLALIGKGEWILHLLFGFACISFALVGKIFISRPCFESGKEGRTHESR